MKSGTDSSFLVSMWVESLGDRHSRNCVTNMLQLIRPVQFALLRLTTFWTWDVATATPRNWCPIYTHRRPLLGWL